MLLRITHHLVRMVRPSNCLRSSVRYIQDDVGDRGDFMGTSKVQLMFNPDDEFLNIQSYSIMGFRVSPGIQVVGPIAIFPRAVLHWNIKSAAHIDVNSLVLFHLIEPKLDLLIIGKGEYSNKLNPSIIPAMKSKGINVEILPTVQACSVFNMLSSEGRHVAGALLPPAKMPPVSEDFSADGGQYFT